MVDLRKCKPGDKIRIAMPPASEAWRIKHKLSPITDIVTYVRALGEHDYYDHEVEYSNGSIGTRTHDGFVYRNPNSRMPEYDYDCVEIL